MTPLFSSGLNVLCKIKNDTHEHVIVKFPDTLNLLTSKYLLEVSVHIILPKTALSIKHFTTLNSNKVTIRHKKTKSLEYLVHHDGLKAVLTALITNLTPYLKIWFEIYFF